MEWLRDLFFYFLVYSFLGWVIEGLFNLFTKGSFIKPNFLFLPLKPMYGFAATWLIVLKNSLPLWLFLVAAFIIPSFIEYLTAYILSHLFDLSYWDYSHCSYQLSGYICLRFSIYWFFLCLVLIYVLQPYLSIFYTLFTPIWFSIFPISFLLVLIDFLFTLKQHPLVFMRS